MFTCIVFSFFTKDNTLIIYFNYLFIWNQTWPAHIFAVLHFDVQKAPHSRCLNIQLCLITVWICLLVTWSAQSLWVSVSYVIFQYFGLWKTSTRLDRSVFSLSFFICWFIWKQPPCLKRWLLSLLSFLAEQADWMRQSIVQLSGDAGKVIK